MVRCVMHLPDVGSNSGIAHVKSIHYLWYEETDIVGVEGGRQEGP